MNATKLKYAAVLSMLVDHIALLLLPAGVPQLVLRTLGRPAFPLFAWCAAEGFRLSHDRRRYLLRLLVFALLSELPYRIAFQGMEDRWCSPLATLLLAGLAVAAFDALRERCPLPTALLPLLAAAIAAELLRCEYGALGVLLPAGLCLLGEDQPAKLILTGVWGAGLYLLWAPFLSLMTYLPAGLYTPNLERIVGLFLGQIYPFYLLYALGALSVLPLLAQYNGMRGAGHRWFFYGFYPLHLLALTALASVLL